MTTLHHTQLYPIGVRLEHDKVGRGPATEPRDGSGPAVRNHTIMTEGPAGGYALLDREHVEKLRSALHPDAWITVDAEDLDPYNQGLSFCFWRRNNTGPAFWRTVERAAERADGTDDASALPPPDFTAILGLFPGLPTRLAFPVAALNAETLFLERSPGKLKTVVFGTKIDVDEIGAFALSLRPHHETQRVRLHDLRVEDARPSFPVPDTTIVDPLGQWTQREWPGKTLDEETLVAELREAAAEPAPEFDPAAAQAGTAAGPTTAATEAQTPRFAGSGYFRTEHDGSRWWLVTPEGYPFYSLGLDVVNPYAPGRMDGLRSLFAWIPHEDGPYAAALRKDSRHGNWHGEYIDFSLLNLLRAFGDDWWLKWRELTTRRMLEWGFNTVGNWADGDFARTSKLPYVWPLRGFPKTSETVFRDFPDVFAREYETAAEEFAAQLSAFEGDRNLIGYFLRNEPQWAFVDDLNPAEMLLENSTRFSSKEVLIQFLSERYGGDVRKLNAAWRLGTDEALTGFEDLHRPIRSAASRSDCAREDLTLFTRRMIERYVSIPSEACKRVDPHHLNLGMRWAWIGQDALYEGSHHFDVFSINSYSDDPAAQIRRVGERSGRPVMIGEFHHGGLDRGLPGNGIRGVRTQEERARAYRHYVQCAAAEPHSVGVHYFTLADQPLLGRFDGENYQIGMVDVCHHPYQEFAEEVRRTNHHIPVILGGGAALESAVQDSSASVAF